MTKSTIKRALLLTVAIGTLSATGLLANPVSAASTLHVSGAGGTDSSTCGAIADPCATIQQAVDNAADGDTITVAAGTYAESVTVDKSLTLSGAQAGTDARSRSGTETIVQQPAGTQSAFVITHDNVTISGFTLDGTDGTDSIGVYLPSPTAYPGASTKNATITDNILTNNKVGIDGLVSDVSGLRVSQNLFDTNTQTGQSDGIFLSDGSGSDIEIADNAFRNTYAGTPGAAAVAVSIHTSTSSYNNVRILSNSSDNDYAFIAANSVNGLVIKDNTASNETKAIVTLDRNVDGVTIADNTFTNSLAGIDLRGNLVSGGGTAISNVTISGNTISGMSEAGIVVASGAIADTPTVKDNSITGNAIGIDNQSTINVTANSNWWGCADGPGHTGCDSTSGPVTADIWYTDAAMTAVNKTATAPSDDATLANTGDDATFIIATAAAVVATALGGLIVLHRR